MSIANTSGDTACDRAMGSACVNDSGISKAYEAEPIGMDN